MESVGLGGWTVLKEKFSRLTVQDLSVVLICASAIYLLRARDSYGILPSWRKDTDIDHFSNGKFPGKGERLPRPIVTDLESDQETEVVMLTSDRNLQILTAPRESKQTEQGLPYLRMKSSVALPTATDGIARRAVVMETGFLETYNESDTGQMRTQVIVVVLENMEVLCFSSDLDLLWQKAVELPPDVMQPDVKSMSVLITAHSLNEEDKGSIYIGGSYVIEKNTNYGGENSPHMQQMGGVSGEARRVTKASPFYVFRLDGGSGNIQWSSSPPSSGIRAASADPRHTHWTKLSNYFLSQMPHSWNDVYDTRFDVIDMKQDPRSAHKHTGVTLLKPLEDIIGLDAHHIEGLPFGGMRPHSDHEHVTNPDTLVVHNAEGIQLLDLETGEFISQLMLREGKAIFVDLEDENKPVRVYTDSNHCQAVADCFHPNVKRKFRGPMCSSASTAMWLQAAFTVHRDLEEDMSLAVPPQVVPSVAKRSGVINNLMGRTLRSEIKGYDSLFLTSSGRLTSYSPTGHFHWQTLISASWSHYEMHGILSAHGYDQEDQVYVYKQAFKPSMTPFSLKVFDKKNLLLILGWNTASLVDLYDGYKLAEHSLPCPPLDKPVIEDFDSDGLNDIIVICQFGYIGLSIEKEANVTYTCVIGIVVVLTVLLLSCFCKPSYDEDEIRPFTHDRME